jgi:hypothetical protein
MDCPCLSPFLGWSSKNFQADSCLLIHFGSCQSMAVILFHGGSVATQKKSGRFCLDHAAGF